MINIFKGKGIRTSGKTHFFIQMFFRLRFVIYSKDIMAIKGDKSEVSPLSRQEKACVKKQVFINDC